MSSDRFDLVAHHKSGPASQPPVAVAAMAFEIKPSALALCKSELLADQQNSNGNNFTDPCLNKITSPCSLTQEYDSLSECVQSLSSITPNEDIFNNDTPREDFDCTSFASCETESYGNFKLFHSPYEFKTDIKSERTWNPFSFPTFKRKGRPAPVTPATTHITASSCYHQVNNEQDNISATAFLFNETQILLQDRNTLEKQLAVLHNENLALRYALTPVQSKSVCKDHSPFYKDNYQRARSSDISGKSELLNQSSRRANLFRPKIASQDQELIDKIIQRRTFQEQKPEMNSVKSRFTSFYDMQFELQLSNSVCHSEFTAEYNLPRLLHEGGFLWKIPHNRSGTPQKYWFQLKTADNIVLSSSKQTHISINKLSDLNSVSKLAYPLTLTWLDPSKSVSHKPPRELCLKDVCSIVSGHKTEAFWKRIALGNSSSVPPAECCFSLVGDKRILAIAAATPRDARIWVEALMDILKRLRLGEFSHFSIVNTASKFLKEDFEYKIFEAARYGKVKIVQKALECGYLVDLQESKSMDTILLVGCRYGKHEIVKLALEYGAQNNPHPNFGHTGLQLAILYQHSKCVHLILDTLSSTSSDLVIANSVDLNHETPLHVSARLGDLKSATLLLAHGADPCLLDKNKGTPLHAAAQAGHAQIVAALLEAFGCQEVLVEAINVNGSRALHLAAQHGRLEVAKILLGSAAIADPVDKAGRTPSMLAYLHGHYLLARLLKEYLPVSLSPQVRHNESSVLPRPDGVYATETSKVSETNTRGIVDVYRSPQYQGSIFKGMKMYPHELNRQYKLPESSFSMCSEYEQNGIAYSTNRNNLYSTNFGSKHPEMLEVDSQISAEIKNEDNLGYKRRQAWVQECYNGTTQDLNTDDKKFTLNGEIWNLYISEDGYTYFFNESRGKSSWDDPRNSTANSSL